MGIFERYLSLWIALSIFLGVVTGHWIPEVVTSVSALEYASVNFVVAVLIWVMIYPMMLQIDFRSLRSIAKEPKGLGLTLVINWLIKPFTMAALALLFFRVIYSDLIPADEAEQYIAGLILLGVAPCTAMVFVWSQLTKGDPNYTLVQVALNDLIMIFAFAPLAGMLLGASTIQVPWETLSLSVLLYVVVPLLAAILTRRLLGENNDQPLMTLVKRLKPLSSIALLATVMLLFAFQAKTLTDKPLVVLIIALPLLIQSYGIFGISYVWAYSMRLPHRIAAPAALIGTSNFFELAVAVAISLFGLHSGAALATVVGVLIEVPVMLSLVSLSNRTRGLFERRLLS